MLIKNPDLFLGGFGKHWNDQFVFYMNFVVESPASENNPNACLHFPWFALQRQVTGLVEKFNDRQKSILNPVRAESFGGMGIPSKAKN